MDRLLDNRYNARYNVAMDNKPVISMAKPRDSYIKKTPGVCGGRACIRDTRVPVWTVIECRLSGMKLADIAANFPGITRDDFWECAVYYGIHYDEINRDIQEQSEETP